MNVNDDSLNFTKYTYIRKSSRRYQVVDREVTRMMERLAKHMNEFDRDAVRLSMFPEVLSVTAYRTIEKLNTAYTKNYGTVNKKLLFILNNGSDYEITLPKNNTHPIESIYLMDREYSKYNCLLRKLKYLDRTQ